MDNFLHAADVLAFNGRPRSNGLEELDQQLADRLRVEWPGILAWMIEGCLGWQRVGLAAPPAVVDATAAYLEAEHTLAAWMDDQCVRDANAWIRTTELFASWKAWGERSGEQVGNIKEFRDKLDKHHIEDKREAGTGRSGYLGLRLRECEPPSEPYWGRV